MIAGRTLFGAWLTAFAASGMSCMPNYTFEPCGNGLDPAVCIVEPETSSNLSEFLPGTHMLNVSMIFANVVILPAGECHARPDCGHVHLSVTMDALAGRVAVPCTLRPDVTYNTSGSTSTMPINLDLCPGLPRAIGGYSGSYTITAELFNDTHVSLPTQTTGSVTINVL